MKGRHDFLTPAGVVAALAAGLLYAQTMSPQMPEQPAYRIGIHNGPGQRTTVRKLVAGRLGLAGQTATNVKNTHS